MGCKEDIEIGGMDILDLVMIYFLNRQIHVEYFINVNYTWYKCSLQEFSGGERYWTHNYTKNNQLQIYWGI